MLLAHLKKLEQAVDAQILSQKEEARRERVWYVLVPPGYESEAAAGSRERGVSEGPREGEREEEELPGYESVGLRVGEWVDRVEVADFEQLKGALVAWRAILHCVPQVLG